MPVPREYQRATDDFERFLRQVRDTAGYGSTHQAYTSAQAVLQVFRRRLAVHDAIRFLGVLPAGLRALFAADWDPDEPRRTFESRERMASEVRSLRAFHNFATDDAIHHVAVAVRSVVDEAALDDLLEDLPPGVKDFWTV